MDFLWKPKRDPNWIRTLINALLSELMIAFTKQMEYFTLSLL